MRIIPFNLHYLDAAVELFISEYSEDSARLWSIEKAAEYLMIDVNNAPDLCFVAINDQRELIGDIFCQVDDYYHHKLLFIDTLQVKSTYRNQGIATELLKTVVAIAKQKPEIKGIHLLADGRTKFPQNWYRKMGFKPTGWVEYEVDFDDLKI